MIKFASKYLPPLMKFMAKSDIRYYLMGIHIEPDPKGGAILCATDGHRMLVIKDKTAECGESITFSINRDSGNFCKKEDGYITIDTESQRLTIFDKAANELFLQPGKCIIAGAKFPVWQRVMPDFKKLKQASLSYCRPQYIADAAMIHPMLKNYGGVRFWQEEENSSVIVEYSHHPEFLAIIMPLRDHGNSDSIDKWLKTFGNPKADLLSDAGQPQQEVTA